MREVDRLTTERYGIPSIILMENAAHAVARVITEKLGGSVKGKSILILCGKGNNGGDGAALGWKLALADAQVEVVLFGKIEDTHGDANVNFGAASGSVAWFRQIESKEEWEGWLKRSWQDWDVVVDAIFGTGLNRPVDAWLSNVIRHTNILNGGSPQSSRIAISIDIPSGLNSDTGEEMSDVFQADVTVTFTAPKPANVLPKTAPFNGELLVAQIGSPYSLVDEFVSELYLSESSEAESFLAETEFTPGSYKNKRGHALVIAGSETYSGAAVLAGNSAIRSGVGLVTLACPAEAKTEIASRLLPEVILATIGSKEFDELFGKANAIAVGPGLSATDLEIESLVRKVVEERTTPVIVDAGALWFFNPPTGIPDDADKNVRVPLILTPHEGEFMRLLGTDDKESIKDRVAAVREFATSNNVILVLKGERVLIGHPDGRVVVNPTGNSGLGKAGNGDTLTGVLAGFIAQSVAIPRDYAFYTPDIGQDAKLEEAFEGVVAAVYVAGLAGDIAEAKYGKRVMIASNVRECLADAFKSVEKKDTYKGFVISCCFVVSDLRNEPRIHTKKHEIKKK